MEKNNERVISFYISMSDLTEHGRILIFVSASAFVVLTDINVENSAIHRGEVEKGRGASETYNLGCSPLILH